MKENLVLDANIWLGFVEEIDLDSLDILSDAVDKNKIKVVLPEFVEDEFNKKVNAVLQRTIKDKKVPQSEVTSIVGTIASIFKTAQKIKTIDEGVNHWVRSGKAPNHNANNYEDTYVLNSLLGMSKGESFYFISKDVDYRPSKNDYNLHPDIKERFNKKGLNIKFSTDFKKVLFNDVGFKKPKLESQKGYELYNWKAFKIQVKNKTILNQLQDAIIHYYKELDFLPLSYLSNIFPFNSKNSSQTYYSGTRLKTDNKELFEFFKNALIQSKENTVEINKAFFKSKKDVAIFREVLKKLNYNIIYHLTHDRSTISIHHKTKTRTLCDCNNCLLSRHEVIQLNSNIEKKYSTDSPKELIKKAFYHFKLKNFNEALKITQLILSNVKKADYPIIYHIALENLNILEGMYFFGDDEFIENRNKIVLPDENKTLKKGFSSIIGYLKYSKFFDYKFFTLSEDLQKVQARYRTNKGIGHSNISNIDYNNVIRYSEVLDIIHSNGLFFDFYSNINHFAKLTFELNLYASRDRIVKSNIDSYIFKNTLPYIKIGEYKSLFRQLNVKQLNFTKLSVDTLYIFFDEILKNFKQVKQLDEKHSYRDYYFRQIKKMAFLLGYINFSKVITNKLISDIYNIYPKDDEKRERKEELFDSLINNRIDSLNKNNALIYIKAHFSNKQDYSFNINNILLLIEKFSSIHLSKSQLDILLADNIFEKTGYYRSYIFYKLHELSNDKTKKVIVEKTKQILSNASSFDCRLYDTLTSEKIIKVSKDHYQIFLSQVNHKVEKERTLNYRNPNDREIKSIEALNLFINHVYEHFDNPKQHLKQFIGLSAYYDFLINPDNFDEEKFDIHWFYIAFSKSYNAIKRIMAENDILKSFIADKIFFLNNELYYRAYLNLTSK